MVTNNLIYKLIEPIKLEIKEIKEKYISGDIKFIDRYDIKFKEKYM